MRIQVLMVSLLLAVPFHSEAQQVSLSDLSQFTLRNAKAQMTAYHGSPALKLVPTDPKSAGGLLALYNGASFHDGAIDVDVAGTPARGADESARGFIGVAFRAQSADRFEMIYLRPTNSSADDQLRRNHTTQYSSEPDWPWDRLRKESPGVYESWVDIAAGEWTHMRIVVHGTNASLYVNGSRNPCLIVHDLKLGNNEGSVGLWMAHDTDGYFRDLRISRQ